MSETVIQVENLWKEYRLGATNHHTLARDLQSWWSRVRGKEDPNSRINDSVSLSTNLNSQPDDRFWALQDVSFEVKQSEILGIIGRNGAGKSTLLKILSQVTAPTKGEVRFKGRIASLLEVGTGFHPELTGRENIFLNGAILGMSKADIRNRLDEIVAFSEVGKFIDTPVKRYSSGMYVRLAFAVAAHLEPEILIIDEVLAVGDAQFQKKCLGKIQDVSAKDGRTVLFVSHNMAAINRLCSRAMVFESGACTYNGTTGSAIEIYFKSSVASFSGFAELSLHEGRPDNMISIVKSISLKTDKSGLDYSSVVCTGDDLMFDIKYDTDCLKLDYAVLGVVSDTGERVFTVGTHLCNGFSGVMHGKGTLRCIVPNLHLAEGEYSVLIALGTRMPVRNVDYIENALNFRVETADFFGTGLALLRGQGYFVQKSDWQLV